MKTTTLLLISLLPTLALGCVASAEPTPDSPEPATPDFEARVTPVVPTAGQLLISEIMFNPSTTEPNTEWFEIHNMTGNRLLLSGLILKDGAGRTHTIASSPQVSIAAHHIKVFARSASDAETTALVPASAILYEYGTGLSSSSGILLSNGSTGGLSILDSTGTTTLAEVSYGAFGLGGSGMSIQLKGHTLAAETDATHWCTSANAWAVGSDLGTPGVKNDCP